GGKAPTLGAGCLGLCGGLGVGLVGWIGLGLLSDINNTAKVTFGRGEEVYYTSGATAADANRLGRAFQQTGFFDNSGPKTARLSKSGDACVIAYCVQDWVFNDQQAIDELRDYSRQLAEGVFQGNVAEIRLCNEYLITRKTIPLPSAVPEGPWRAHFDAG